MNYADLTFPERGLDLSSGLYVQRPGTTPEAVNVRVCEPATERARGGSRPGLVKFIDQQLPLGPPVRGGDYWPDDYFGADYFGDDYWR